jgi:transposase InsO family protein
VGALPDRELLRAIRREIDESPFTGEGHRKLWARLRRRGICTSRKRVLRLCREAGLLAPTAKVRRRARRLHEGTITVERPDTLWATDPTQAWTDRDGRCAVFALVDHATGEAWVDAAPRMDRFAAADLLREAIASDRSRPPRLRGSHSATTAAPAFALATTRPSSTTSASNARRRSTTSPRPTAASKFIQTLKEQVLWIERFETLEELRARVREFARTYNEHWLLERHGYRSPREARQRLLAAQAG